MIFKNYYRSQCPSRRQAGARVTKPNTVRRPDTGQSGSVLIGVMAFGIMIALGSLGLLHLSASTINQETTSLNESRAFYAAESGLLLGAKWMENQQNCDDVVDLLSGQSLVNVIPGFSLNGFDVHVDIVCDNHGISIYSKALSSGAIGYNKIVSQLAEPGGGSGFDTTAFKYGMFTDSKFTFLGTGTISQPDGSAALIHSNDTIDIGGNAKGNMHLYASEFIEVGNNDVDGTGRAPDFNLHPQCSLTDTITEEVPEVPFPEIDLSPWEQWANVHKEVRTPASGTFDLNQDYTPNGGILWVNGNVHLKGGTFTGQLIATGNVKVNSEVHIMAPDTGFAIASQNGEIENQISWKGHIEGLVYAKTGPYKQTSSGSVLGQIIIRGNIDKMGKSSILTYKRTVPVPPGGMAQACPNLVAGSWQERMQ